MAHIIAFSGSNSSASINQALTRAASKMIEGVEVIDLRDYDAPIYSIDIENESGIPESITSLVAKLHSADAFIIATPEHNSLMPAFFKNILDWLSRTKEKPLGPTVFLSTSPGRGGAAKAVKVVEMVTSYLGAETVGTFSLPSFKENFDTSNEELTNSELKQELAALLSQLETS